MNKTVRPVVWIVKEQLRRNSLGSDPMDYGPAMAYGEIRFITKGDLPLYGGGVLYESWYRDVAKFCVEFDESRDFIITTGQPTAIFAIGHALGCHSKIPRYLVWQREENRYRVFDTPPDLASFAVF
jgi:hypothetical protein